MGLIIVGFMAILIIVIVIVFIVFIIGFKSNDNKKDNTMIKPKYKNK